jgi:hypothetical protein
MGDFESHQATARALFPAVSLPIGVTVYALSRDALLVGLILLIGERLLRIGAALPDIDSHQSVPRRLLGHLITWLLLGLFVVAVLSYAWPWKALSLAGDESGWLQVCLWGLIWVVWSGVQSRHRSLTHSGLWIAAVVLLVSVSSFVAARFLGRPTAVGLLVGCACYCSSGLGSHLWVDDERKLVWSRERRSYTAYKQYLEGVRGQYLRMLGVELPVGIVVVDSSLVVLGVVGLSYVAVLCGRVVPLLDRKGSRPRVVFDWLVWCVLGGVVGVQVGHLVWGLWDGVGISPEVAIWTSGLAVVLWVGRDSRMGTVMRSRWWSVAAVIGSVGVVGVLAAGLPSVEQHWLAGCIGLSFGGGLWTSHRLYRLNQDR